ncbi:hypothetical protein BWK59_12090 [Flavobacterium davisii]|uniref:Lipoprotein n=1 Tax=Flavobacterium davisii TaxID=2906077 RepID=A0A246GG53_9FLAO|nr:hypothetical protein [Flavobacterium davisii]OWP83146.1 hypothetical protein BWK59_12090 [Flavobacterium davisii]
MKKLILIITLFLIFLSCKDNKETKLLPNSKDSITITTPKIDSVSESNSNVEDKTTNTTNTDCYDYLTELVRSSNFPFSDWDVPKEKVNLIIDEHNSEFIRAKLTYETEGTGTIGWIEYVLKTGVLKNTSTNLEVPEKLKYDKNWKSKFDECNHPNDKLTITNKSISLEDSYKICKKTGFPISYSYEFISELPNFTKIQDEIKSQYQLDHLQNLQQVNLTNVGEIKPVLVSGYLDSGESELYLILLDGSYNNKSKILLYSAEEIDGVGNLSTTFEINKNFEIKITKNKISGNGKNNVKLNSNVYKINNNGTFSKLK